MTRHAHRTAGGALLALLAAVTPAAASTAFGRADVNHDGFVSFDEAEDVMPSLKRITFDKVDRDDDGMLTRGEYASLDAIYEVGKLRD